MNLKTIKVLLFTLLALTLASFLIGCGVSKPVYFLFTALFAIGYAAVWLLCWRWLCSPLASVHRQSR